eukprot:7346155-Pyramimonas_sp.AAC.1
MSLRKKHAVDMIADLLTKFLNRDTVQRFSALMGFGPREGQHLLALGARGLLRMAWAWLGSVSGVCPAL